jgi:hypothetical protein
MEEDAYASEISDLLRFSRTIERTRKDAERGGIKK